MSVFKYRAFTKEKRTIAGMVEAPSEDMAVDILRDKELEIISLVEKRSGSGKFNIVLDRVKTKDIVMFSRQFSVLIGASVALVQSLKLLADQTKNVKFKGIIGEIADEVDGGAKLSDSLAKRPKVFSDFYVNVVRSGETSGKLDEVLTYLADELEKDYDMTSKIKGAMIYPAFVLSGLTVVGAVMMIFVVPKLTAVIAEGGGELPLATKIVIFISDFLANYYLLVGFMIAVFIIGFRFFLRIPMGKKIVDIVLLRLPIFGKLFQKIYLVRFTRSLQTLLKGGVNITKGLAITAEVVANAMYREIIVETKKEVEDGNSITSAMEKSPYVPVMVSQMIGIGEKTGRLDIILESITNFYSREIDNTIANLMTLMEPIIMVIMGVGVGTMVAAIIMPMYSLSSQF
ncbi:type II secretion system F family protein [Candidatus Parcubacteria bacterium]|nr:type II secretion system F family protein [Candidatus Parcubacteria bacterium]